MLYIAEGLSRGASKRLLKLFKEVEKIKEENTEERKDKATGFNAARFEGLDRDERLALRRAAERYLSKDSEKSIEK